MPVHENHQTTGGSRRAFLASGLKNAFLTRELDGDLVLYDPVRDVVHTLNPTARQIWECCDGAHTGEDVVREIAGRYGVSSNAVREDVKRGLVQLKHGQIREGRSVVVGVVMGATPDPGRQQWSSG